MNAISHLVPSSHTLLPESAQLSLKHAVAHRFDENGQWKRFEGSANTHKKDSEVLDSAINAIRKECPDAFIQRAKEA